VGGGTGVTQSSPEDHFKVIYYKALDTVIGCISDRFKQEKILLVEVPWQLHRVLLETSFSANISFYTSGMVFLSPTFFASQSQILV